MSRPKVETEWEIELWAKCPGCDEFSDFIGDYLDEYLASDVGGRVDGLVVFCPHCQNEFEIDADAFL